MGWAVADQSTSLLCVSVVVAGAMEEGVQGQVGCSGGPEACATALSSCHPAGSLQEG